MFNFYNETAKISNIIKQGAESHASDTRFIELEIQRFKASKRRRDMITAERYYIGEHDILRRKRTVIGTDGRLETVDNLPNNRIIDNQYRKAVNQKVNYLLGQPFVVCSENKAYEKAVKELLDKRFMRLLKNVGKSAINCGVGWIYVFYGDGGELAFKQFKPYEIIPGWADTEHTTLDYAIRLYEVIAYEGDREKVVEKVEVYTENGIDRFILEGSKLSPDEKPHEDYITAENESFNWAKIPLIPFKANNEEFPLIKAVKSLQDGLNRILSDFQNNMEEDARNTILVLVNYDGTDLGEFRRNLAQYGAVKIRNDGSNAGGDVKTLSVKVNAENYKAIIELFKKAIIENAMCYDAKDDRLSGNPNQMNIQSMYSDIDLDANEMETEFQAAFEELLEFINIHLYNVGAGDFESEEAEIVFNRDMLMNESEAIENVIKSASILSEETTIAQHPWVDDVAKELERIKSQREAESGYAEAFNPTLSDLGGEDDEE